MNASMSFSTSAPIKQKPFNVKICPGYVELRLEDYIDHGTNIADPRLGQLDDLICILSDARRELVRQ